jgi:ATP-dependent Clp protease ATP-binding subunit ClpA
VSENRFNEQVQSALGEAEAIARRLRHGFIDTEHLLLSLMAGQDSLAGQVLFDMGLDPAQVEDYIRQLYQDYPPADGDQPLLHASAIDRALFLAAEEASWLGHDAIGTEHVILGLMRWQEGGAVEMLRAMGIAPGRVRRRMRQMQHAAHLEVGIDSFRRMTSFSELAHRILNGAIEEAARAGHGTVGVEHLLLVLCRDRRNVAGRVLRELGVDVGVVESLVAQLTFPASLAPVFEVAVAEAAWLGDHYLGTDHLLLAICQDPAGGRLLHYLGSDAKAVQARLYDLMAR